MTAKNQIDLDFSDNAELAEIFANKSIGDECEIKVKLQINRKDEKGATGTVKEIEALPHDDSDDEDETDDTTQNDEPVSIMMGAGRSKKTADSY